MTVFDPLETWYSSLETCRLPEWLGQVQTGLARKNDLPKLKVQKLRK